MLKREIIEDSILAIIIVSVFGGIFSVTHAFQTSEQENPVTYIQIIPTKIVQKEDPIKIQNTRLVVATSTPKEAATVILSQEETVPEISEVTPKVIKPTIETPKVKPETLVSAFPKPSIEKNYAETLVSLIEEKTNAFREDHNLPSLRYERELEKNAQKYSTLMLSKNFFSHVDKDGCDLTCRFNANGYQAQTWGENLAMYEFSTRPSAEEVASYFMKEWQKSAGHRENLLSSAFTHQGIGVAVDGDSIYVTVDFSKPIQ